MTTNGPYGDEHNQGAGPAYGQEPAYGQAPGYPPYPQAPDYPPYPQAPGYGAGQPQSAALPGLAVRLGARFVDNLILTAVNIATFFILGYGFGWMALSAVLTYAYFVGFDVALGATLGKKAFNLRVAGPDGGRPGPNNAAVRELFVLFNIIPVLGPFLLVAAYITIAITINSNPQDQGIHDRFAGGTRVLRG
ncbi:RDD family protein [Frankia tisae]|uniref:RDD family protein n=1 Tax=Frankia tisae TaxID=2950104 RepID=UPI0021C065B7|nr:RDD family protein [Frankia tisae]